MYIAHVAGRLVHRVSTVGRSCCYYQRGYTEAQRGGVSGDSLEVGGHTEWEPGGPRASSASLTRPGWVLRTSCPKREKIGWDLGEEADLAELPQMLWSPRPQCQPVIVMGLAVGGHDPGGRGSP